MNLVPESVMALGNIVFDFSHLRGSGAINLSPYRRSIDEQMLNLGDISHP